MNRDLIFLIVSAVFIIGFMGWFIGNLGLEDYLDERSKRKDSDPFEQEKINELTRRIEESEEIQRINELKQLMDELDDIDDKGDDD